MKRRQSHRRLRFAILIGVPIDGVLFYVGVTEIWGFYAGGVVFVLLAFGTIWDAMSNYAESAAVARLTAYSCDELYRETDNLWISIEDNTISNEEVIVRHNSITERWARYTERVSPEADESLLKKTQDESDEFVRSRYGG